MDKSLPPRPNLDHLRRQAKTLLAALASGDAAAAATFLEFLPAAKGMTPAKIRAAGFRLADAQSAVARKSGFAAWPQLARHVEQLRSLEGTWSFERLEIDGSEIPAAGLSASRLLMDGDRFRMESPEATYEGVFNIDVEAQPHHIDIEFIAGPEAGNTNRGIFRLDGDRIDICLDISGAGGKGGKGGRPAEFRTAPGSNCAFETLVRSAAARPHDVTGGTPPPPAANAPPPASSLTEEDFKYVPSPLLTRLQGEWSAQKLVRDGQELPSMMLKTGSRSATGNEIKIRFGGQLIIHALVRIDESASPIAVDYFNLGGMAKGTVQLGIMEWRGEDACFCMAAPGEPRPSDFEPGSGRTLSEWRKTT